MSEKATELDTADTGLKIYIGYNRELQVMVVLVHIILVCTQSGNLQGVIC